MTRIIPIILRWDLRDSAARLRLGEVVPLIVVCAAVYGGVMGSFGGASRGDQIRQIFYSAVKVPMLLGVSFALTIPGYFILSTLLGLREDFRAALRAVAVAQAGSAIVLASLCPFVAMWYTASRDYSQAILFNGLVFGTATLVGHVLIRRHCQRLIQKNPRHRSMLRSWTIVYVLVAVQMAWVLRPFIGHPAQATTFFRHEAWGNAYVVIWGLV